MPFSIRPFVKRPHPKSNPNAVRINLNSPNSLGNNNVNQNNTNNENNKIDRTKLGNVGNISTLAYLYCDLQNWGKTVVRQGHRDELDPTKPQIWVFCPLLKAKIPHDRILVEACKKCPHFKSVTEPKQGSGQNSVGDYKVNFIPMRKKKPMIFFEKEQLDSAEKLLDEENEKWKQDEHNI